MVVLTTLNSVPDARAQKLASAPLAPLCDLEVHAGGAKYPAHRAVLALHSAFFRSYSFEAAAPRAPAGFGVYTPPKAVLELTVAGAGDHAVRIGWDVVHRYCYGHCVELDTASALHAAQLAREYRFDELAVVLDAFLRGGGVDPRRCTAVFASAVSASRNKASGGGERHGDVVDAVRRAAWRVLKERFADVEGWRLVPWAYMVRLMKLNDLRVDSEMAVWRAVAEWCEGEEDSTAVAGLAKLVRFPTMTRAELAEVQRSPLLCRHPAVARYVRRGVVARENDDAEHTTGAGAGVGNGPPSGAAFDALLDSSPVYRRRRPDALTFTDHIPAFSTLAKPVHTSTRYFAGALWRIVVDPSPDDVGLYVSVLSEESHGDVNVAFDFAVFVVSLTADANTPRIVKKQANDVHFSRSGQRAGFASVVSRRQLDDPHARNPLVINDTLYIGASIRLRTCSAKLSHVEPVVGIHAHHDDTDQLISF